MSIKYTDDFPETWEELCKLINKLFPPTIRMVDNVFSVKDWRTNAERELTREMDKLFREMNTKLSELLSNESLTFEDIPEAFWEEMNGKALEIIMPRLQQIAMASANRLGTQLPLTFNWELVNQRAIEFIRSYTYGLTSNLSATSRNTLAKFFEEGLTRQELVDKLNRVGELRAEEIAVTEVTRASAEGERALVDELAAEGVDMIEVWMTNEDELVCDICLDKDGKEEGDGWTRADGPPAHVNCRCWVNHYLPGYDWKQE